MSGHSILIDTNIALYLLDGDQTIANLLDGRDVYVSFITELELLGYKDLSNEQLSLIENLLNDCIVVDINQNIKQHNKGYFASLLSTFQNLAFRN